VFLLLLPLIFLTLSISYVRAQNANDVYFESIRGELLSFYGSEIVAHANLIVGLAISSLALIAGGKQFFKGSKEGNPKSKEGADASDTSKRSKWKRVDLRTVFFFLLLGLILVLTIYSLGRLMYWSFLGADVLAIDSNLKGKVGNTTSTALIFELHNLTIKDFENSSSVQYKFARAFFPNLYGLRALIPSFFLPLCTYGLVTSWRSNSKRYFAGVTVLTISLLAIVLVTLFFA